MIGSRKGYYHSELARMGPIFVTVKSDVKPSKREGTFFVVLEHDGTEQFYNIENDQCADKFRGKVGQSFTIRATGAREDADILIENSDGTSKPPGASPPRSNSTGGSTQPPSQLNETQRLNQIVNALFKIEKAVMAESIAAEDEGIEFDAANFGGKCGNVMRLMGNGFVDSQPTEPVWGKKKNKPGEKPEDDDIPF